MIATTPPAASPQRTTCTPAPPNPADTLALAKAEALDALRAILRKDDASDREKRLAATAILKYAAAVEPPPPPAPDEDDDASPDDPYATDQILLSIAYEKGYADHANSKPAAPLTLCDAIYEKLAREDTALEALEDDDPPDSTTP